MMDRDAMLKFLEDTAQYFENRPTNGEDRAHWANVYNAENCRKIATFVKERENGNGNIPTGSDGRSELRSTTSGVVDTGHLAGGEEPADFDPWGLPNWGG